jgi:ABC-type polysaccharide/polyol phosphate export permease
MTAVGELYKGRELLWNLTLRELRGKFKRTALGWAWSMLNPISTIVIYSLVFGNLFQGNSAELGSPSGLQNFTLWLSVGLLVWNFTNNGIQATLPSIVGNSNLVKKVYFPREYVVAASVLSWLVTFLIELLVLSFVFLIWAPHHIVFGWIPAILVVVFLHMLFVLGVSLLLSALNVYFRDIQHFVGIGMQIWFYLTPIVYKTSLVQDKLTPLILGADRLPLTPEQRSGHFTLFKIFRLNPMMRFVDAYRKLIYSGALPPVSTMVYLLVVSFVMLLIGWRVFSRLEPRFAEEL